MNTTRERREAERERAVRVIAELEGRLDRRQRNHVAMREELRLLRLVVDLVEDLDEALRDRPGAGA